MKLRQLLLAALFAALMCISVFLRIPIPPTPLVFTLQTFVVFIAGLMLEPKYALSSMLVYTLLGLLGLPVFSTGGGIGYVLQTSFGFIIGFSAAALVISLTARKSAIALISGAVTAGKEKLILKTVGFSLLAIAVLYICGITYMYFMYNYYIGKTMSLGYIIISATGIFMLLDIAKFAVALPLSMAVLKRLPESYRKI